MPFSMFSLRMILISSLGLIMIGLICPTSGISIKTLTETTKLFFEKVEKMDSDIKSPESLKEFEKIHYYTSESQETEIESDEKNIASFITEFKKLNTSNKTVVDDYLKQINTKITEKRALGTEEKRIAFCDFYDNEILPKFTIEGYGKNDVEVQKIMNKLTEELGRIYNTIKNAGVGIAVSNMIAAQNIISYHFLA